MKHGARWMVFAGLTGMALVVMTSCAQPPSEQLDAARKAVDAAKAVGAPDYAKDDFVKLEQQFAVAKDELTKQENVLAIFRSYAEADKMLIKVVEASEQVTAKAAQNKEAAKIAALVMEKETQQVVASARELMAKAPTGKERTAVEKIKEDLGGLETSLTAVHQSIEKGDYLGAEAQAKPLKEKTAAVSLEIQTAIDKAKGGKPGSRRGDMKGTRYESIRSRKG